MTSTREKIEALAVALLDDALNIDTKMPTKEKVEIFKPVSLWYLGTQKAKKGEPDDTAAGRTFTDLVQQVNGKEATKQ